ncbi:MAG: phytanoyl-CoA dioxygenase family protein [Candidatus Poribacteria bacterium]|nr:phytanoyl-CoA dioxygenase family protein [Candidatus Poribacteria bacterium]
MALTDEQKQSFEENGYLVIRNLLSRNQVETLRERADLIASGKAAHVPPRWIQEEPAIRRGEVVAKSKTDAVRKLWSLVLYDEVMRAHATHPKIVDVIVGLLGPDIKLYGDQLFMKPPEHGSRKEYHQDSNSWRQLVPYNLVSCWAALDNATVDNGCLWMIPGSHKWGLISREREREIEQKALSDQLGETEVPVELNAGDCSFHHSLLLHSSHANRSAKRRRGYATHYMSAQTKYVGDGSKSDYLLIRGREFPGCV